MPLLRLLGAPRLQVGDDVVALPVKQSLLLGSYLAYKEDWASRDELLHLFWPDESEKTARHNLSQLLYHCKRQPWLDDLEVERTRVRWLIDSDVGRFREALGEGQWDKASGNYSGTLLEGVALATSLNFEDWLEQERESLQGAWREAVLNHAAKLKEQGKHSEAARLLREVLIKESLAEDVLQAYMKATLADGQRDQALRAYETFCKQLEQELGMEPLEATKALAQEIRSSLPSIPNNAEPQKPLSLENITELYAFPTEATPFIGRDLERAELATLFADEAKLITLLGAGGVGKTRLALQVAREQAWRFSDGVVFVALATLDKASLIAPLVLQALSLQAPGEQDDLSFLLEHLADKTMLLVFDNTEHLPGSIDMIIEVLENCPDVYILLTSREALGIQSEQLYDLGGLSYPAASALSEIEFAGSSLEAYDAITLFLRSARRAHASFHLSADNRKAVIHICQLLQGSPLGLELAATWVRLLNPAEIAEELQNNLDLLESSHKDLPERHRSMRAVFEYSWSLLSDAEQAALAQLSVFRGGFDKASAVAVTNASLRTLLSLVNKSLLQRTPAGRFERHVVVQQFSQEKLAEDVGGLEQTRERHADYFAGFVETARPHFSGAEQAEWLNLLRLDHNNLRAALQWFITQKQATRAMEMSSGLFYFWWLHGHYQEGRGLIKQVLALDAKPTALRARVLNNAGGLARLCENLGEARSLYEESLAIKREVGDSEALAETLGNLGMLSRVEGDYSAARKLLEECAAIFRASNNKQRLANTLNNLAAIAESEGDRDAAWDLNEQSLELANQVGERFIAARCLGNLGAYAYAKKDYAHAQTLREESLSVFLELDYKVGIAVSHQGLGDIALGQKELAQAATQYAKAITCFKAIEDKRGIAEVLASFAELAVAEVDFERALICSAASLNLHQQLGIAPMPDSRASLDKIIAKGKENLSEAHWQQCLTEAQRLSADAAVRYALNHPIPADKVADSH